MTYIAGVYHRWGIAKSVIVAQVWINTAAAIGACVGPLIIGALTKADLQDGWRKFWVRRSNPGDMYYADLNLSGLKWRYGVCVD